MLFVYDFDVSSFPGLYCAVMAFVSLLCVRFMLILDQRVVSLALRCVLRCGMLFMCMLMVFFVVVVVIICLVFGDMVVAVGRSGADLMEAVQTSEVVWIVVQTSEVVYTPRNHIRSSVWMIHWLNKSN